MQHVRTARVGERHVVEAHADRSVGQRLALGPGSATSRGVSRTPSTRRRPATAFCASLSTSVAICTGCTNSVTRNRKPTSWPVVIVAVDAEQHADDDDRAGGEGGGQLAGGEGDGGDLLRAGLGDAGRSTALSMRSAVRPWTAYARMTCAPTTDSATAPSISPTRSRTTR